MKSFTVLLIATLVGVSHQQLSTATNMSEILQSWRRLVEPHMSACMCQSNAKLDLINSLFDRGEISNDPCFKCNLRCWAQQVEIMSTSGVIDPIILRQRAAGVDDPIARKCSAVPGADFCQRAHNLLTCVLGILSGRDPYPGPPASPSTLPAFVPNLVKIGPTAPSLGSPTSPNILNSKSWGPLQYLLETTI